ncbi:hypothetical protein TPR58_21720 [Sphingomonas sp. HF-S3]|uniref:Type II secretion system protein M n=1 Tax=Sphingomonas rustica TaxID=3103142 RepID=A0ABV0BEY0_9SPHN
MTVLAIAPALRQRRGMSEDGPGTSLSGRIADAARARIAVRRGAPVASDAKARAQREPRGGDWRVAAALAGVIALGPILTVAAASWASASARGEAAALRRTLAPRIAAERQAAAERETLVTLVRRPGAGVTLDALARAIPPESSLVRVERNAAGRLEVEVAAADPDRLREALRREPVLAGLRDAGQRQSDQGMIVSLKERGE